MGVLLLGVELNWRLGNWLRTLGWGCVRVRWPEGSSDGLWDPLLVATSTYFQGACFFFMLGPWVEPGRWPAYSVWWSQQQRMFQDAICYFLLLRVMRAALLTPLTLPAGPFMAMLAHVADQ